MKIIAHRCGTDKFPQQTIHSARYSLSCGASLVEVDIRFTKDNIPVVIHDDTPQSLYGECTPVCKMTAEHFLSLRRTEDKAFCGHLFKDYLDCGIKDMLFHIKEGGEHLYSVLDLCRSYNILDSVVFGVTSAEDVRIIKAYSPDIKVLGFIKSPDYIQDFAQAGAEYIRLWQKQKWLTAENVLTVKNSGKKLWIMANGGDVGEVVNGDYELYSSFEPDGILINKVVPAIEYFNK